MSTPRLEQWAVGFGDHNHFRAPEIRPKVVRGSIYGSERYSDGEVITTSAIRTAVGRTITTASGNQYVLGVPEPEYLTFLAEQRIPFDPANPVTIR